MFGITKVMFFFAILISAILFWTTSNVCRYNFAIEKKTKNLNIIVSELSPNIPLTEVYYFQELNCNIVDFSFNHERILKNLNAISVLIYQELTTDIKGQPN